MIDPFTFGFGTVWALLTVACWSVVLRDRWGNWKGKHDLRAKGELIFIVPLWAISVVWGVVLFLSVIRDVADAGAAVRGLLFGFGVGLYTLAAVVGAVGTRKKRS